MIEETKCPECGSKMVSRKNKQSGEIFWGCSQFPVCKGTRDNEGKSRFDRALERGEANPEDKLGLDEEVQLKDTPKYRFKKN